MKKLQDILYKVHLQSVNGKTDIEIKDVQIDSRKISAGSLFIAIKGEKTDGHQFIDKAIELGAAAVVVETITSYLKENVTYIQVSNSHEATGYIAHNFYDEPSLKLKLVGITGTNGKTTIATVLFKLFKELGYQCGLISTVQNQMGDTVIPATHTTPDAISLNALLKQMTDAGCTHAFMECSSHAIDQHRITGLFFSCAIFTQYHTRASRLS